MILFLLPGALASLKKINEFVLRPPCPVWAVFDNLYITQARSLHWFALFVNKVSHIVIWTQWFIDANFVHVYDLEILNGIFGQYSKIEIKSSHWSLSLFEISNDWIQALNARVRCAFAVIIFSFQCLFSVYHVMQSDKREIFYSNQHFPSLCVLFTTCIWLIIRLRHGVLISISFQEIKII